MIGIGSSGKEAMNKIVEDMFNNISASFIGDQHKRKSAIISFEPNLGLAHLFVQSMKNQIPNEVERDFLKSLLESASGYIDSLKSRTKATISDRIDGLVREAHIQKRRVSNQEVQAILNEEFKKAKNDLRTIVESESTKFRNLGTMMDISRVATSIGDEDPTVFFIVTKDNATCKECLRLHLMPDQVTPRLWKFSELKQSYHKRGNDSPSAFGLHPHCFTGDTKLHTTNGLISIKELFDTQQKIEVFVDNRIKNRREGNNQYGKSIPGSVWLDRHSHGARALVTSNVYDTGIQECIKITLSNGMNLSVSLGHEMWVDDGKSGIKINAENLEVGQKIPLISGECGFGQDSFPELAELMGNLMGDGTIGNDTAIWNFFGNDIPYGQKLFSIAKTFADKYSQYSQELTIFPPNEKYNVERASFNSVILKNIFQEDFNLSKKPRRVPERLWKSSKETVAAFLRGLYAADGHIEKTPSVIISQNDIEFLKEIQLLLSNFGLISRLYIHGEGCVKDITYANGDTFSTNRKPAWRLILGGWAQCAIFAKEIGMGVPKKQEQLLTFLANTEGENRLGSWRTSRIVSIENLGLQQTYCLTEPMTNTVTANGVVTGQCRCTLTYLSKGFGFDSKGRLTYNSENFDAYSEQD